jgi:hypothetical protein
MQVTFRKIRGWPGATYHVMEGGLLLGTVHHVQVYRNADFWRAFDGLGRMVGAEFDTRRAAVAALQAQVGHD